MTKKEFERIESWIKNNNFESSYRAVMHDEEQGTEYDQEVYLAVVDAQSLLTFLRGMVDEEPKSV